MSWKLFFQIILLIIITVVVLGALKCGMWRCKRRFKGKPPIYKYVPSDPSVPSTQK